MAHSVQIQVVPSPTDYTLTSNIGFFLPLIGVHSIDSLNMINVVP